MNLIELQASAVSQYHLSLCFRNVAIQNEKTARKLYRLLQQNYCISQKLGRKKLM